MQVVPVAESRDVPLLFAVTVHSVHSFIRSCLFISYIYMRNIYRNAQRKRSQLTRRQRSRMTGVGRRGNRKLRTSSAHQQRQHQLTASRQRRTHAGNLAHADHSVSQLTSAVARFHGPLL